MSSTTEDEEKALPEKKETTPTSSKKAAEGSISRKYVLMAFLFGVALVVAISVPLALNAKEDDSSKSSLASPTGNPSVGAGDPNNGPNVTAFSVFDPQIPNFNTDILTGYETEEDFAAGVTMGLRSLLDRVVGRNLGLKGYEGLGLGGGGMMMDFAMPGMMPEGDAQESAPAREPVGDDVNDFETNNQEEGVEEGDIVMSNGILLFIAYGDHVVVVNPATGDQVMTIRLPDMEEPEDYEPDFPEPTGGDTKPEEPPTVPEEPPTRRRDSSVYWPSSVNIQSMLLLNDARLVVFANGYNMHHRFSSEHVIDYYLGTRVLVYDVSTVADTSAANAQSAPMEPLATKDLSGYFVSVRAIDGNVHVVTSTSLIYYDTIILPFEKWHDPALAEMSDEDYVDTVVERANTRYIPDFVDKLMSDLRVDGVLPRFAKINTYDDGSGENLAPFMYTEGYMQSAALVYSFDIATVTGPELTGVSASGAIVPAYGPTVYASLDTMIIATSGMGYSEERDAMLTKTYLMSFQLSGAESLPYTIGSMFGDILSQYSMDVLDGVLRIATTIRTAWFWGMPEPAVMEMDAEEIVEDEPEPEVWEESTTEIYITTLSIEGLDTDNNATTPNIMTELDNIKIGKPDETITAVRFFERYAYAVTFRITDPFYKLDMLDPFNIEQLAEVEITGFSQYLHAFDDTEEVIIGLGQDTDEEGAVLGLMISLFDMRDDANPQVIRYNIEIDPEQWSDSEALWDKNAVRFNQETGLLSIPVNMQTDEGWFNGFKLFLITLTSITEVPDCSVELPEYDYQGPDKPYCAWMSPRSMIFSGSMVVMKEHTLVRKDLDTCVTEWETQVSIEVEEGHWCSGR